MKHRVDIFIKNATIVDGSGNQPVRANVAIKDGTIAHVGSDIFEAREEIDATGMFVTPGFIDFHTHYDGQSVWSNTLSPSNLHGVTTVLMGNCGVGFAPVRPEYHAGLIDLMEGVEDIPGVALAAGLDWSWETFPEFLDLLSRRRYDVDICTQLPHAPVRVYVMGDRALRRENATPDDLREMRGIVSRAIAAGAFGVSSSQSRNHRSSDGSPMPTYQAESAELLALAQGVADAGRGVMQFAMDFDKNEIDLDCDVIEAVAEIAPVSFTVVERHDNPNGWKQILARANRTIAKGLPVKMQVAARPIGILLGLQGSRSVFSACPTFAALDGIPLEDKVASLRRPEIKAQILSEFARPTEDVLATRLADLRNVYVLGNPPEYDPGSARSLENIAADAGVDAPSLAYDLQLEEAGRALFYSPFANYAHANLDACEQLISHPESLLSLGDGGAHVGLIADSSTTTFMLTHWVRRKGKLLEWAVRKLTGEPAQMLGLSDRGFVREGLKADLNVIDLNRLAILAPSMVADLPAGGSRFVQGAEGYVATILSGQVVARNGRSTGELPGRLVRSGEASIAYA